MGINWNPLDDGRKKRKREKRILKNDSNRRRISTLKPVYIHHQKEKNDHRSFNTSALLSLCLYTSNSIYRHIST